MNLQSLVESYGYAAVFVGSLLEGETVVIMGGLAAHAGYLELPWVIAVAFSGGFLGDQIYFYLGRWHGDKVLARFPTLGAKRARVQDMLRSYDAALIVGKTPQGRNGQYARLGDSAASVLVDRSLDLPVRGEIAFGQRIPSLGDHR